MYPVTVFITRFRAAVGVLVGRCCPALLKLLLLYCWANKMVMMMMMMMTKID